MGFSAKQVQALRRDVNHRHIRTRIGSGRELSYIEGGHVISEANRIFGFDGWSRETVDSRCVLTRETRGVFLVVYTAKARITVSADTKTIIREGQGSGEARCSSPGEAHDLALKIAETDATKRALATFGKPFGLSLYSGGRSSLNKQRAQRKPEQDASERGDNLRKEVVGHPTAIECVGEGNNSSIETHTEQAKPINSNASASVDKSVLTFGAPRRHRDKVHLKFVGSQPCLLCSHQPSDPHHLRFAQARSLGRKVSDEFTVPLCRTHHRQLHHCGNEVAWWHDIGIEPLEIAKSLWNETHSELKTD